MPKPSLIEDKTRVTVELPRKDREYLIEPDFSR